MSNSLGNIDQFTLSAVRLLDPSYMFCISKIKFPVVENVVSGTLKNWVTLSDDTQPHLAYSTKPLKSSAWYIHSESKSRNLKKRI